MVSRVYNMDTDTPPKVGTRVVYIGGWNNATVSASGKEGVVTRSESTYERGHFEFMNDDDESTWVGKSWRYVYNHDEPIPDLTDTQKDDLARRALAAAKTRGYCDETKNILRDLGLPTRFTTKRKVTIEFEVEEPEGVTFASDPNNIGVMRCYNNEQPRGVKILSAKVID